MRTAMLPAILLAACAEDGAEAIYVRAEAAYQAADFESAFRLTEEALRAAPDHAPANALKTEILFVLGRIEGTTPVNAYLGKPRIDAGTFLAEIASLLDQADFELNRGETKTADIRYRKAREYLKWLPRGPAATGLADRAEAGLRWIQAGRSRE